MTPHELKDNYIKHNPDGHFFDHKTMAFFGDALSNFECLHNWDHHYILTRINPVKLGSMGHFVFDDLTFEYIGFYS